MLPPVTPCSVLLKKKICRAATNDNFYVPYIYQIRLIQGSIKGIKSMIHQSKEKALIGIKMSSIILSKILFFSLEMGVYCLLSD